MKQDQLVKSLLCAAILLLLHSCTPHRSETAIRIRWPHDPETLDPLQANNQVAFEAANLLHFSLLQTDFALQQQVPALAESLPTVRLLGDSLTQLRYRLRPQATWDSGQPVLASDVAFTLKLMFCPGLPNESVRPRFAFIEAINPDPAVSRLFTLVCRGQSLEYSQASGDFFILSEAALDPHGQLRRFTLAELQHRAPATPPDSGLVSLARRYQALGLEHTPNRLPGCGPYQLVKWEKDRYLTFRRKPHWWADQLRSAPLPLQARTQQLDYVIIPDAATATLALRRGDLDVYPQMPAREFSRLEASSKAQAGLKFYNTPSYDVVIAGFNTRHAALADALTRRALSCCFDAAGLLRATQLGSGQRTASIISPTDRTNYNDSLAPLPFAPDDAARLLRRAGWQYAEGTAGGWFRSSPIGRQQLKLVMRYRADEALFTTVALQFQAATAKLGIPVLLRPTESGTYSTALRAGDFDVYVRLLKGNPFMFNFMPMLHSKSMPENNVTGFSTPASDKLIEAITTADTEVHRTQLLRRFQGLLQQEMPLVPLFTLPNRIAANRRLSGLHISNLKPGYSATTLELAPPSSNP